MILLPFIASRAMKSMIYMVYKSCYIVFYTL
jgi:hypothetical protein